MIIISANAVNRMLDPEKKPYKLTGGCFVSGTVKKVLGGTIAGLGQVLNYNVFLQDLILSSFFSIIQTCDLSPPQKSIGKFGLQ